MDSTHLKKLKVNELKDLLAQHDLPTAGKKEELIARLLDAAITGDPTTDDIVAVDPPTPVTTDAPTTITAPAFQPGEHVVSNTPLSTADQLKKRADRFGTAVTENALKAQREIKFSTLPDTALENGKEKGHKGKRGGGGIGEMLSKPTSVTSTKTGPLIVAWFGCGE
jgi:hypothetical protein